MSIVITDLCKSFGSTPVLQRFTWTVERPMVLMGRSGCGNERTFRQEYEASFESYDGLVARDFDRELNKSNETIKDDDTLIIGIDFNVNKMPCSISVLRGKDLHCLDFLFGSFNTEELMKAIQVVIAKMVGAQRQMGG